jgi:hypothetical protein
VSQWQIICKVTSNNLVAETQGYAGKQHGNYIKVLISTYPIGTSPKQRELIHSVRGIVFLPLYFILYPSPIKQDFVLDEMIFLQKNKIIISKSLN